MEGERSALSLFGSVWTATCILLRTPFLRSFRSLLGYACPLWRSTERMADAVGKNLVELSGLVLNQNAGKKELDRAGELLSALKKALIHYTLQPPFTDAPAVVQKQLLQAREVYELGALHSCLVKDVKAFDRYVTQVKPFYTDYASLLASSPSQFRLNILGLNLLYLLSYNLIADFHIELELLVSEEQKDLNDKSIKVVVEMERSLMDGSYNKVLKARSDLPTPRWSTVFMDILDETVREKIASCAEKAYESFPVKEVGQLLLLSDAKQVEAFMKKRNWVAVGDRIVFASNNNAAPGGHADQKAVSMEIIDQTLGYATELERIH